MTSLMQARKNENGKRHTDFYEFNGITFMKFSRSMKLTGSQHVLKICDEKSSQLWVCDRTQSSKQNKFVAHVR